MSTRQKPRSESPSSPFLERFTGKLTKIDKSGTLSVNSKPFVDVTNQKAKTTMLGAKLGYTVEVSSPLPEIKNKRIFKVSQKAKTDIITPSKQMEESESSSSSYYIDSILPKNISLEMDFKEMLEKLNDFEFKRSQKLK